LLNLVPQHRVARLIKSTVWATLKPVDKPASVIEQNGGESAKIQKPNSKNCLQKTFENSSGILGSVFGGQKWIDQL
jgi:hypothetical protein